MFNTKISKNYYSTQKYNKNRCQYKGQCNSRPILANQKKTSSLRLIFQLTTRAVILNITNIYSVL